MNTGKITFIPIPALKDNYIWLISNGTSVAIIDPGEAAPVKEYLARTPLRPVAILTTHRHRDHIGGVAELLEVYNVPVYGRKHPGNPLVTHDLREGDTLHLELLKTSYRIMELPGHLEDHIVYVNPDHVLCGDILFGGGCGKNFEGSLAQLLHSLQRLASLPKETAVYCAHEYTLFCLAFALNCEPDNHDIRDRLNHCAQLRQGGLPTLPSSIGLEQSTNPFLRCHLPSLRKFTGHEEDASPLQVFTVLYEKLRDFRLRENAF